MKNFIVLFGFAILIASCGNGGTSSTSVKGATIDLTGFEIQDIPSSSYQKVTKRSSDGVLLEQGMLLNGKRNGMWVKFHPDNEAPQSIVNYVDDVPNGSYFSFNTRGQLEEMRGYINNEFDGKWATYKFGRTMEEADYQAGKFHATYRSYFANSDKIQKELQYKEGKMHGDYKFFNEEGQVTLQYKYNNDKKVSGGIVKPQ